MSTATITPTTATASTASTNGKGKKAPPKGKGKPDTKPVPKKDKAPTDPMREKAKASGLSLSLYRILAVMAKHKNPMTYREMEEAGVPYSPLTAQTRKGYEGSLGELGLVKELEAYECTDGKTRLAFELTAKGRQALAKTAK